MSDCQVFPSYMVCSETYKKFLAWKKAQEAKAIEFQKKIVAESEERRLLQQCWDMGFAYAGAIGGAITFKVTPTSIGTLVTARHNITEEEFELTDWSDF